MSHHHAETLEEVRHVKVAHLVMGLVFLGVVAAWALAATDAVPTGQLAFLGPAVLILAGVVGLAASLAGGRRRRESLATHDTSYDEEPTALYESYDPTTGTTGTTDRTPQEGSR